MLDYRFVAGCLALPAGPNVTGGKNDYRSFEADVTADSKIKGSPGLITIRSEPSDSAGCIGVVILGLDGPVLSLPKLSALTLSKEKQSKGAAGLLVPGF